MEASLILELCLQPDTIIVRKSSNRPKLQYHIESTLKSPNDLQKHIQEIIYSQKLGSSERGLVFITSISDGLLLAKGLQCKFYCADDRVYASSSGGEGKRMLGKESNISKQGIFNLRSDIVKRWREGADEKNKILISTTAFSTGNDYPEVQVVILAITPFDMSTALQEMGRAGRDSKLAKCYIIPAMKILPHHSIDDSWDLKGHKTMYDMI